MKRVTLNKIIGISFVVILIAAASIYKTAHHIVDQSKQIKILQNKIHVYEQNAKLDSAKKQLQIIYEFITDYEITEEERKIAEELFMEEVLHLLEERRKIREFYRGINPLDLPSNDSIY